jgi:MFS family permease
LLGLSWGGSEYPWGSLQIIGLFVFSAVMWVLFVLRELRAAEPVINPRLFENSIFTVSSLASAIQSAAMFGAIMFLPLYVQAVLGKSATNSGVILMPMMLAAMATAIGGGQILAHTGRYKILVMAGFGAVVAGAYLLSLMGVDTSQATLARNMVIMGLGLGIAMSSFTVIVQNQYPTHRLGEVTAGLQFFRQIGSTVGLAIFGTILNNQFAGALTANLPAPLRKYASGPAAAKLENPQVLLSPAASEKIHAAFARFGTQGDQLFHAFMNAVRLSLAGAISDLFVLGAILGAIGFFVVLFLKEVPLRRTHAMDEQEVQEEFAREASAREAAVPVAGLEEADAEAR